MIQKNRPEDKLESGIFRVEKFSRRQFVKSIAVVTAGAAIASLHTACKPSSTETTTAPNTDTASIEPSPGTSSQTQTSSNPPASSGVITITAYVPPKTNAPVITIAGTSCAVATDRLYSTDHIWVKQLNDNFVVVGITLSMFHILYNPWRCALSPLGTTLARGDNFGVAEGYKMTSDLISPVSGTVLQINPLVVGIVDTADGALIDLADPYNRGWMMVIQLSKPAELGSLLTAQQYASFVHE